MSSNFDFGGHLNDDNLYESEDAGFEEYLTVEALLCLKFGDNRGRAIYALLFKYAQKASKVTGSGIPGLLFRSDGGEFISFHGSDNAEMDDIENPADDEDIEGYIDGDSTDAHEL